MKLKLDRIISIATLIAAVAAIVLVLKRPAPVSQPATVIVERAASDQNTTNPRPSQPVEATPPSSGASTASEVRVQGMPAAPAVAANPKSTSSVGSDEMSSMVTKMLGSASGNAGLSPDSNVGAGMPNIKDQQVTMEGDIIHGRFLTEIAGKEVWVTISGHMGEKDGYATFEPTEFKVGDMEVPVSLVNPALQRKLAEERDRLKIPTPGAQ
ncbi:MAG TPA: hypothetical protein VMG82_30045 [Candidatus Sulfotelmatobacter sp.]|nr:hypothetical protein [Candidatus Sulfotelmatobacter sp.]